MPRKKTSASSACETLDVDVRNSVGLVALNRPQLHNAFNETLIAELTSVLHALDADASVRAVS
jgi:enoyl-CoA hydratase/carnithine racemase